MSPVTEPPRTYRTEWVDRWCPPKPLVGIQPIEKLLNRHTEVVGPEARLVVAVIARAIHDSLSPGNRRQRREARRFLEGERLTPWCDLVGLNPDFVRFVARKAGYFADEKAHWQQVPIKVRVPAEPVALKPVVSASSAPVHAITCHASSDLPQGGLIHA